MSPLGGRTARRGILGAAAVAIAAGGLLGGLGVSALVRPSYRAIAWVALPDPAMVPQLPAAAISPSVVLRADGALVGLTESGYREVRLPAATAAEIFATLARSSAGWADAYPLAGVRAAGRVELRLLGASARTITIDDPLGNAGLPDPLFRIAATLLHPDGIDPAVARPVEPPSLSVRSVALEGPDEGPPTEGPPAWLDLAAAGTPGGQLLAGDALTAAAAAWPPLRNLAYPYSSRTVSAAGAPIRLAWAADWTAWIEAAR